MCQKRKRKKPDNRSQKVVLVGYHSTRGYKLLDPLNNKVFMSRDVIIDESNTWN